MQGFFESLRFNALLEVAGVDAVMVELAIITCLAGECTCRSAMTRTSKQVDQTPSW
jgi:hypothetical protein